MKNRYPRVENEHRRKKDWSPDHAWHEQCQACKRWVPRKDVLRQLQAGNSPAGTNRFPYSSYSASGWSMATATSAGTIGMGRSDFYYIVNTDGTATYQGIQSWTGDGILSMSTAINCSSYSSFLIAATVAPGHIETSNTLSVEIGMKNGATDYTAKTWSINGTRRIWGVVTMADVASAHLSALTPYFSVTTVDGDNVWWIDGLQGVEDETSPPRLFPFIRTTGSAVARTADQNTYRPQIVCPRCVSPRLILVNNAEPSVSVPPEMDEDLSVE